MTVRELILKLESMPQEMNVWTEGCDCWGRAGFLVVDEDIVLICRTDSEEFKDPDKNE